MEKTQDNLIPDVSYVDENNSPAREKKKITPIRSDYGNDNAIRDELLGANKMHGTPK